MYALSQVSFKIIQQQTTMEMVAFELWYNFMQIG